VVVPCPPLRTHLDHLHELRCPTPQVVGPTIQMIHLTTPLPHLGRRVRKYDHQLSRL
jgi:hypothetical protein